MTSLPEKPVLFDELFDNLMSVEEGAFDDDGSSSIIRELLEDSLVHHYESSVDSLIHAVRAGDFETSQHIADSLLRHGSDGDVRGFKLHPSARDYLRRLQTAPINDLEICLANDDYGGVLLLSYIFGRASVMWSTSSNTITKRLVYLGLLDSGHRGITDRGVPVLQYWIQKNPEGLVKSVATYSQTFNYHFDALRYLAQNISRDYWPIFLNKLSTEDAKIMAFFGQHPGEIVGKATPERLNDTDEWV